MTAFNQNRSDNTATNLPCLHAAEPAHSDRDHHYHPFHATRTMLLFDRAANAIAVSVRSIQEEAVIPPESIVPKIYWTNRPDILCCDLLGSQWADALSRPQLLIGAYQIGC
jgi:hypothetical protein